MKEGIHDNFVLFYSNNSPYSNFYPAEFSDPELMLRLPRSSKHHGSTEFMFSHVEQYMHASKALLFRDEDVLEQILDCRDAMMTKRLGRRVDNFVDKVWSAEARNIVTRGCWLKFSQNEELWQRMDKTGDKEFVECATRDIR